MDDLRAHQLGVMAGMRAALDGVLDRVRVPFLVTHGVNDPRVEVWESTKTAARLMAATRSDKPILMRLDFDAGHGVGSTLNQRQAMAAPVDDQPQRHHDAGGHQPM